MNHKEEIMLYDSGKINDSLLNSHHTKSPGIHKNCLSDKSTHASEHMLEMKGLAHYSQVKPNVQCVAFLNW